MHALSSYTSLGRRSSQAVARGAMAGPTAGCYIDLFEEPDHGGTLRRLYGPAIYPAERRAHDPEPATSRKRSRGRGVTIESIIVGPAAYVLCFVGSDDSHRPTWL